MAISVEVTGKVEYEVKHRELCGKNTWVTCVISPRREESMRRDRNDGDQKKHEWRYIAPIAVYAATPSARVFEELWAAVSALVNEVLFTVGTSNSVKSFRQPSSFALFIVTIRSGWGFNSAYSVLRPYWTLPVLRPYWRNRLSCRGDPEVVRWCATSGWSQRKKAQNTDNY